MSKILIIGGTGNTGGQVIAQLAEAGLPVRAMVRNPDAVSFPGNVETVQGDLTVPDSVAACTQDIDSVFVVWTAPPATVERVLEHLLKHARRIVFLSGPYKTPHPLFQGSQPNMISALHARIEKQIEASGREWTFLRPGMLASNARFWWARQIRAGVPVRWPYLNVPTAPIHERDIAAVAVRALTEDGHAGAEYTITGPEPLTHFEQLSVISDTLGIPVRIEELSPEEARTGLLDVMPLPFINLLLASWGAADGHPAFVTSTVRELTGTPASPFSQWVKDHAGAFRNA